MGHSKLCLLLLLCTIALAYAQEEGEEQSTCLLAKRYKTLHKYEYQYEAESLNAINGASQLQNGPKGSCKVEIEVPQTCSFILRTTGCSLSEVIDMDAEGHPVFGPAAGSDAFAAEMEKHALKVVVEGVYDVKLFPEEAETKTILNIKRGIVSALAVPLLEEELSKRMPTIHGMCKTHYSANAREDIATDVTLTRDLSKCDHFIPMREHTSPLALISGMHYPLAQLIRSSQTCNYKFDNEQKHMTSGACTENHILLPFSHKGEYGVTNVGKQSLTLVEVSTYNDRVFDHNEANLKGLHMEVADDHAVAQDKDAGLALLRELAILPQSSGDKRAHLFHRLVTMVRGMKAETLGPAVPEALEVSPALTYQVLAQCGTPECSSAIMQILRTYDSSAVEVDATVFAMGLLPNPSALLVKDMLEMAKYKQSKTILYALSNAVKRFYKAEGKVTPEIHAVAEFAAGQLGDCSGDQEHTFLALRVIGNMAAAMGAASPALRTAVIQCVNQPAASPAVQEAAIQAYRLTPVPEEGREVLMQVLLDGASPLQRRVAAYLVLMKDPQPSELAQLAAALPIEQDNQAKSFVISHLTNILESKNPETLELRQKILTALQGNEVGTVMDPIKFSRNYKIGSLEGNMLFDGSSYLPKEVMLEMTLKAFGFDIDVVELGMEGKGLEPTVEALFGENGFFPDTVLKTLYFVSDKMPASINEVLKNMLPALRKDRKKRETTYNLMKEIGRNVNKLVEDLKAHESPEAMVYLRLLGNELGYLKTNEMENMAHSAALMVDSVLKMAPTHLMKDLMIKTDNEIFAHYIFMDNEFFLPTATGVPLKIALSGTFTPGVRGGLNIARDMSEISFMPSAGIEFVTQVGSHIPEYVDSGLEMHTSLFHESGLNAKISFGSDHVKLTIPAPENPAKLISITNSLVAVTTAEVKTMPPVGNEIVDVSECTPFFSGMKYCTALHYIDASSEETSPYFPFTGDSKFVVKLHPTGEVTEYSATLTYELLMEGEEGDQKVDAVKMVLKAEGGEPTEVTATAKYNRKMHIISTDVQIPDFDIDAGIRLGFVDDSTKGKGTHSVSLILLNKNIPQLSLLGNAKLEAMKDAKLQVQLLVPSVQLDAEVTAHLKRDGELELELESDIKLPETTSVQKISLKYDGSKIEAEVKSDLNSEILKTLPDLVDIQTPVQNVLALVSGITEPVEFRYILTKSVEVTNQYLDKHAAEIPYVKNFRVPDMPEITLPEKVFLNTEAKASYHFNEEHFTLVIPLPLGGKSTVEMNFPPVLTTPHLNLPQLGLEIESIEIPIPELFVPEKLHLSVPLFGKAEVSTVVKSNLYDLEGSIAVGKDIVDAPSFSGKVDLTGSSPFEILSFKIGGSGLLAGSTTDSIVADIKTTLNHKLIDGRINILGSAAVTDKITVKSSSIIEAKSPTGLEVSLEHTGQVGFNAEEISGDSDLRGSLKAGPIFGNSVATHAFAVFPFKRQVTLESVLKLDSTMINTQNNVVASFANGELSVVSNTNVFKDLIKHVAELSFKEHTLALKCNTNALAFGMKIHNQAEASAGLSGADVKIETNADHSENHIHSLLTASLNGNGLSLISDASVKVLENEGTHQTLLSITKQGVTTSGSTSLLGALALQNTFNAALDLSKATLSIANKGTFHDMKIDNDNSLTVTLSTLKFNSKADAIVSEETSYSHDIALDLQPYTVSANVNNHLKVLAANFVNEADLKAEHNKIDLTGTLKAIYGEEEIKHTYEMNYADLTGHVKCSTTGKLFGTQLSHNTVLQIMGLVAKIDHDARFNSQLLRFDHTIAASIVPFDFNLNAIFNADGDLSLYGKQSGQLFGKLLLRAQPLAFVSLHECRASLNQQLDNGFALQSIYDNKMDTLLTPLEQKTSLRIISKLNSHEIKQEISAYNNAEKFGVEISNSLRTSLLNTANSDNQEFSISGFLKYDKNTDSHIVNLPFFKTLPAVLENAKTTIVSMAEALLNYINTEDFRAKLNALPQHVSDFLVELNLESKVVQLKQNVVDFTQEYVITIDDLEASLVNLKHVVEKCAADLAAGIQGIIDITKEIIVNGILSEAVIQKINHFVNAINEEFNIRAIIVAVLDAIQQVIMETDLQKLKESSISLLHEIDAQFNIKDTLELIIDHLKQIIESFDLVKVVEELKDYVISINLEAHFEELMAQVPIDLSINAIEGVKTVVQDLDILGKLNAVHAKTRELIVKFEVDKKVEAYAEKVLELIKQLKIDETIQILANNLRTVGDMSANVMLMLEEAINNLKATDVNELFTQLHDYLESIVQKLKNFDYNDFAEKANKIIAERTAQINELIRELEIQQKCEATRELLHSAVSFVVSSYEQLRGMKIVEVIESVMEIIDQTLLNGLKTVAESLKLKITDVNVSVEINSYLQLVRNCYDNVVTIIKDMFINVFEVLENVAPEQKIVREVKQIIEAIATELNTAELEFPSFTIPFTNLHVPTFKISMDKLQEMEIPTQLDIPEFTILGFILVPDTTFSLDDLKHEIIRLIDFIVNFDIQLLDSTVYFGDLTMNYLPDLPSIALPEITISDVSFPTFPDVTMSLVETVQIPEIKLPTITSEIRIPLFGKLYSEVKVSTPVYSVLSFAELKNTTDNMRTPQFTAAMTTEGNCPSFEELNYKLESALQLAVPKMSRVIVTETVKFTHTALGVEHQASVTLYGLSAQALARTSVKVTTSPYTADIVNTAFFAMEGGVSVSMDTAYNHKIDIPRISLTSDATLSQQVVVRQEGTTLSLTAGSRGTAKFNSDEGTHESSLFFIISPGSLELGYKGNIDSTLLKVKQTMNAKGKTFRNIQFDARLQSEGSAIQNSLVEASGHASLGDLKAELKVYHYTLLVGDLGIELSNKIKIDISPIEVVLDFQNKANTKVNVYVFNEKIDLQIDHSITLKPDAQHINTIAVAHLNQQSAFYNFTFENDAKETAFHLAANGEANIEFLNTPISIPEFDLPFVVMYIPEINDLNLYEHTGLKNIFTTTDQPFDVDTKIVYQKSQHAPIIDAMGLVQVPSLGNLITELSFKSKIFNLNANAGLYGEEDLVLRLGATTASVFEGLTAKLEGSSGFTTKRGLKFATALSLENPHIEGTHDSTFSMDTDNLETVFTVSTVAKINLPILNLEANQRFVADTKTKPNAASTLKLKGEFNLPIINAVGKAEADHSMKLEGSFEYVSIEETTKGNIDGTLLENYSILGALDNEANLYLNVDGLRSTCKMVANSKLSNGETKIVEMDVDENLAIEASPTRVYAVLKFASKNEENLVSFTTTGNHVASAKIDLTPSFLNADVEIDLSQPSSLGDMTIFEKVVVEWSAAKQKISANAKIATPVYSTNLAADIEGEAPVFKVIYKSSAISAIVFLEYDMDASITGSIENEELSLTSKAVLTHTDLTMDIHQVLSQVLRKKRQDEASVSSNTLNVDITSPTFTDVNFRYAARRDGVSASISTPSTGFLGVQFQGRALSHLSARLYSRYASAPEADVDILMIKTSAMDADKMNLQVTYNMEAPIDMLLGLKDRLTSFSSALTGFAGKYNINVPIEALLSALTEIVDEGHNIVVSLSPDMSQLSIFFRNVIVQYQKSVQVLLNAAINFLRETQFKVPGTEEMTTLPQLLKKLTSSIATILEQAIQMVVDHAETYFKNLVEMFSTINITMPIGEVITGAQIMDQLKLSAKYVSDLETVDVMLEKFGELMKFVIEKTQEFVDSVKSDILDEVFLHMNFLYNSLVTFTKNVWDQISTLDMEQLHAAVEYVLEMVISVVHQFNNTISGFLLKASEEDEAYVKVIAGKLVIDLPFPFHQ